MGLIKIFSGNETLALDLQSKIEAAEIKTVVKNNIQTTKVAGSRANQVVEIFIKEIDFGKVHPIIEDFRMRIA
jgi:hypothetical protein